MVTAEIELPDVVQCHFIGQDLQIPSPAMVCRAGRPIYNKNKKALVYVDEFQELPTH